MTAPSDPGGDQTPASGTVDDWLPDVAANDPAPPPKRARRPKVNLNPVAALGAELDDPPVAARPGETPAPAPKGRAKPRAADAPPADAPPEDRPPPRPPRPARPRGEIWDGCPVRPLGVNGDTSFYLDVLNQLRVVAKHDAQKIQHLFGHRIPLLQHHFPQFNARTGKPQRGRFDQTTASMEMIAACAERGLFNPDGAVRGVGAWTDDDGGLIYHTGDRLLTPQGTRDPAPHQGRIYPAYPPIPGPAGAAPEAGDGPAERILEAAATWNWARPEIDPMLILGMIGVQKLGGALGWRPNFWFTGSKSTGKSSLQDWIRHLHGTAGLIQSSDATKSGITSRLGQSSLPVAVDELEPGDEGSNKERDIIVLARVASSGGQWFRGSADQKGVGGNVYSAFLFSSILMPAALKEQDVSRLVVLSLRPFPEGTPPQRFRAETWRRVGAQHLRLLIDRWPTWAARLELWREAFAAAGLSGRNGDNWATVLAMADAALQPGLPDAATLQGWARKVAGHVKPDADSIGTDADSMLLHLLSQPFDIYRRGEQHTIAQWLMVAAQLPGAPPGLMGNDTPQDRADAAKMANDKLAKAGLRITGSGAEAVLFIASSPIQGLKDLFRQSTWAGGVWSQSAARVPGARSGRDVNPRKLQGIQTRGTEIPLTAIPGLFAFPADRVADAPAAPPTQWSEEDFA